MEAVGQLTGGIAHDFNNLLTVIVANLDRAKRLPQGDDRALPAIDNALTGARRAAALTDQLLAFARKQPLQPEVQDLSQVVVHGTAMLGSTLGPQVTVVTELGDDVWPVCIDTNQAQNALLNLAVNARDAMPDGGILTVRTRNVPAAGELDRDEVLIEVADTGTGMAPETIARAFDPFFTTKGLGKGTGLGLSQVYGFINQSGGRIEIDSTIGRGTTIRIWLPRA